MSVNQNELRTRVNAVFSIWVKALIDVPNMRMQVLKFNGELKHELININKLWEYPESKYFDSRPFDIEPDRLPEEKTKAMWSFLEALNRVIQERYESDDSEFVSLFRPILTKMQDKLLGVTENDIPLILDQKGSQPKKIPLFFRNKRHKEFMKTTSQDLEGLIHWLEKFYCNQYLLPNCEKDAEAKSKCSAILEHLKQYPPQEGQSIQAYLNFKPQASLSSSSARSLAEIIGHNRKSSNSKKQTWGMEKIMESFQYKMISKDAKPKRKPKTKTTKYEIY